MGPPRRRRWILWIFLAAAGSAGLSLTGAPASQRQTVNATFELQAPVCSAQFVPLGRGCVDSTGLVGGPTAWPNVADGSAQWTVAGKYAISYEWQVPQTIGPGGGEATMKVTASETSGTDQVCPAISMKGELATPTGLGFCVQGGQTDSRSIPVKLASYSAAAGSTADLIVSVQDGPYFIYRYRATAAPKPAPKPKACRRPAPAGAPRALMSAECELTVTFAVNHGGWRKGDPKRYLDVTTNAIGRVTFTFDRDQLGKRFATPPLEPNDIKIRVVRTIHVLHEGDQAPTKARLVFRAREGGLIRYVEVPDRNEAAITVPLTLVSSNDPDCRSGEDAVLLAEETEQLRDRFSLAIDCPVHSGRWIDGKGRKPLVRVAITRK